MFYWTCGNFGSPHSHITRAASSLPCTLAWRNHIYARNWKSTPRIHSAPVTPQDASSTPRDGQVVAAVSPIPSPSTVPFIILEKSLPVTLISILRAHTTCHLLLRTAIECATGTHNCFSQVTSEPGEQAALRSGDFETAMRLRTMHDMQKMRRYTTVQTETPRSAGATTRCTGLSPYPSQAASCLHSAWLFLGILASPPLITWVMHSCHQPPTTSARSLRSISQRNCTSVQCHAQIGSSSLVPTQHTPRVRGG